MGPAVLVSEDTPLRGVAALMLERHIENVLVADAAGAVGGLVTDRDLTLNQRNLRYTAIKVPRLNDHWVTSGDQVDAACIAAETMTAREVRDRRIATCRAARTTWRSRRPDAAAGCRVRIGPCGWQGARHDRPTQPFATGRRATRSTSSVCRPEWHAKAADRPCLAPQ
jgi:hypothetical protein